MPRSCTICTHEEHHEINVALVQRAPYRHIASRWNVSTGALQRHSREHIPPLLTLAADAERSAQADSLLDRIEALQGRTEEALKKAEESDNLFATFRGISEIRRNLELIGEVTKELDRTPTLNLHLNPQYIAIRTAIQQAVEPYPEVAQVISQAMLALEEGNGSEAGAA